MVYSFLSPLEVYVEASSLGHMLTLLLEGLIYCSPLHNLLFIFVVYS